MLKNISLGFFVTVFFTVLFTGNVFAEELNKDKGSTDEFYLEILSEIEELYFAVDSGEITEDEFVEKIEQGLAEKLQSEEDINSLIESEEKVASFFATKPYYGIEFGVKATEVALVAKHPAYGLKAKKLATQASKEAERRYKKYTLWQGNGDAFRHAYWSALMTKHTTKDFAYKAGYAHEVYKPGTYDKISSLDIKMDIRNNHLGRDYGTANKTKSDSTISNGLVKKVNAGDFVRIRTHTTGSKFELVAGVKTKYTGKFIKTSSGGNIK